MADSLGLLHQICLVPPRFHQEPLHERGECAFFRRCAVDSKAYLQYIRA